MELFPFSVGCRNKDSCDHGKLIIRNITQQIKSGDLYTGKFSNDQWNIIYRSFVEIVDCFAMASNNKTFYKAEHCYSLSIQMAW